VGNVIDPRPLIQADIAEKEKELEKLIDHLLDSPKSVALTKRLETTENAIIELQEQLRKVLPPDLTSDNEYVELIQSNYYYHYGLRDMHNGSNFYGKFADAEKLHQEIMSDTTLPKSKRLSYERSFARHKRFVEEFGDNYSADYLNGNEMKKKIHTRLTELRQEMQVGLRRLVGKIEFHHLPIATTKPKGGYIGHNKAKWGSYKITLNSGGVFERWYEMPNEGFQIGHTHSRKRKNKPSDFDIAENEAS
jgi:hypothetical protein